MQLEPGLNSNEATAPAWLAQSFKLLCAEQIKQIVIALNISA
jgi:hypothetical protein